MMNFETLFSAYKEPALYVRYVTLKHVEPIIDSLAKLFEIDTVGYSVQAKPIYRIIAGHGKVKVFIWSQMHGNESTTTKAIFF